MQQSYQDPNQLFETPLCYFAFGSAGKSSLLNEYSRQHKIIYLQNASSEDLSKLIGSSQCIIEASVDIFNEWESKYPNISVIFIGHQFSESQERIRKEYQHIGRCKFYRNLNNYESFRKVMYPNLIFFYGPAKEHREGAAATTAFQSGYKYISQLPQNANKLISSLNRSYNYTFNWVFTSSNQIQILLSRFNIRIIHFKYYRTDYPNNEQYFDIEYQLLNYLRGKNYFLSVDAIKSSEQMMDQIGEFLCPKITFINANNEDQKQYARNYAKDKNIQSYSIFDIQAINKRKNIPLAMNLQDKIRRITSIIFNDLNASEVVLFDFPWHAHEFRIFENVNRKLRKFVDLDQPSHYYYSSQYSSNMYFLETQRRLTPNLNFPLANQIEQNQRYWLVVGPQGIGKTSVAKYLENQYQLIYIEYEPYIGTLKQKLITPEDGQQLPYRKIVAHFKQLINRNPDRQYVIDGFVGSENDLRQWIGQIGAPTILNLKAQDRQIIRRQRTKAQSDVAAQVTQEQAQRIRQLVDKQNQWVEKLNQISPDAVIYNVDYSLSLILAEKLLQSIFQPRVFLVQSNPTLVYQNIAIRYNCCLINLALYNLAQAKQIAKKSGKRDVIILNYHQISQKLISQDLYWIQKNIGKIRYLAIWNSQQKTVNEQKIHLQRPVQQKKIKQKVQGQQQQPPVQQPVAQQGQVKKKQLDIFDYQWTKPTSHLNLSQWYLKLKHNVQQNETQSRQVYDHFQQRLDDITNNPSLNIYEVLKSNDS